MAEAAEAIETTEVVADGGTAGGEVGGISLIDAIEKDPGETKPVVKPVVDGRPDYIPEKFWDKEAKAPRVEDLAKSYASLEAEHSRKLKGHAGAPEAYEFTVPEDLGGQVALDMEDGFTKDALELFKKHGITQEAAQDIVGLYLTQAFADATGAQAEELSKLGPDARQTIQGVNDWARVNLDVETYKVVRSGANTAASVLAIKSLIERIDGASKVPTKTPPAPPSSEVEGVLAEVGTERYHTDERHREDVDRRLEQAYARAGR